MKRPLPGSRPILIISESNSISEAYVDLLNKVPSQFQAVPFLGGLQKVPAIAAFLVKQSGFSRYPPHILFHAPLFPDPCEICSFVRFLRNRCTWQGGFLAMMPTPKSTVALEQTCLLHEGKHCLKFVEGGCHKALEQNQKTHQIKGALQGLKEFYSQDWQRILKADACFPFQAAYKKLLVSPSDLEQLTNCIAQFMELKGPIASQMPLHHGKDLGISEANNILADYPTHTTAQKARNTLIEIARLAGFPGP